MISNSVDIPFSINKIQSKIDDLGTLDNILIHVASNKMSEMQRIKEHIQTALSDPVAVSDPATLITLQALMADYTMKISFLEKMAGSVIKIVDTLVKS